MNVKFFHVVLILTAMVALHFTANAIGMYESRIIWIDKVLHIMAGSAIAMLWVWFLQRRNLVSRDSFLLFSSVVGFVALVAIGWEIVEYGFWRTLPNYATIYNIYSPNIFDLLSDVVFNLIGGSLFALYLKRKI